MKESVEKNNFVHCCAIYYHFCFAAVCSLNAHLSSLLTDGLLIGTYVRQALNMMMFIYLGWKCVALNAVLAAKLIVKAVMNVNLVESVAVRKWPAR
jgi:hypothetical protein